MTSGESFIRMTDRGHGLAVYTRPEVPRKRRPKPEPTVVVRAAPAAAVALALRIAGGDASRLVFSDDGSVTVLNGRRL